MILFAAPILPEAVTSRGAGIRDRKGAILRPNRPATLWAVVAGKPKGLKVEATRLRFKTAAAAHKYSNRLNKLLGLYTFDPKAAESFSSDGPQGMIWGLHS